MSERSVCVLDMVLYKALYNILSHCVLSCVTDCFTLCLSLRFVNALTINEHYTIQCYWVETSEELSKRCMDNLLPLLPIYAATVYTNHHHLLLLLPSPEAADYFTISHGIKG